MDYLVAALVWNMGIYSPVAQISNQTAFVLQGDGDKEKMINTNSDWKVVKDNSYTHCSTDNGERLHTYVVICPATRLVLLVIRGYGNNKILMIINGCLPNRLQTLR